MELKDNLRTKREEFNLSQAELAEKLAVSRQTIIKWEKGENYPDMVNLVNLSRIFDVTIDELTGNTAAEDVTEDKKAEGGSAGEPEDIKENLSKGSTADGNSRDNIMLVLAVVSLIVPYGIGLIVAIYVRMSQAGKRRGIVKVISSLSIALNVIKVLFFVLIQLLW